MRFPKTITLVVLFSVLIGCAQKKEEYYCPMHPTYTSDRPGTCPICNMDLVKRETGEHSHSTANEEIVTRKTDSADPSEFALSSEKQQSIGIKTAAVERRDLVKTIRAYSTVAYDPELYTALSEYKELVHSRGLFSESGVSLNTERLQIRLKQLGLSVEQIRLWTSGKRDPAELILGGKNGRAHVYSQIYETDSNFLKVGSQVVFTTNAFPERTFRGNVKSIDTILDRNSRTLRLRSEVADSDGLLKPQMFGDLEIAAPMKRVLSVPASAILETGLRKIVYVRTGPDRFAGKEVRTGRTADAWVEVVEGLEEGQYVVIESAFLVDSEAKIRFGSSDHKH